MQSDWENAAKVVGASQVRRALNGGIARRICLARDADPSITGHLAELAEDLGVPVEWADSARALGKACGISVKAAAAAEI